MLNYWTGLKPIGCRFIRSFQNWYYFLESIYRKSLKMVPDTDNFGKTVFSITMVCIDQNQTVRYRYGGAVTATTKRRVDALKYIRLCYLRKDTQKYFNPMCRAPMTYSFQYQLSLLAQLRKVRESNQYSNKYIQIFLTKIFLH